LFEWEDNVTGREKLIFAVGFFYYARCGVLTEFEEWGVRGKVGFILLTAR